MADTNIYADIGKLALGGLITLIVTLFITLRKEKNDREAQTNKIRAEYHFERREHLSNLLAYLIEYRAVSKETYDLAQGLIEDKAATNLKTIGSESVVTGHIELEESSNEKRLWAMYETYYRRSKELLAKTLSEAEQYGCLPDGIKGVTETNLSRYVRILLHGKIERLMSISTQGNEKDETNRHIDALIIDIRTLSRCESTLAKDAHLPVKERTFKTPSLPYFQRMGEYVKPMQVDINKLYMTRIEDTAKYM